LSKYIKFRRECAAAEITLFDGLAELNAYRRKLLRLRLIGVDANGIGFGNLSIRDGTTNSFYITGSATGGNTGTVAGGLRKSGGVRFQKELAPI
jgi:hypothetical protein